MLRRLLVLPCVLAAVACSEDPDDPNNNNNNMNPADTGMNNSGDSGITNDGDGGVNNLDATLPDADEARRGVPVLGYESHSVDQVIFEEMPSGGLNVPRDLAWNPHVPGELWVVNRADDSTVTYIGMNTA